MAITAATLQSDLSGFIDPVRADYIFERASRSSVVQQLVQRVPLGPAGVKIPIITGRPTAGWIGEAEKKPASAGSISSKVIEPKKLAAIMVASAEVARLNPAQFLTKMQDSLAETFAIAFDRAALHDEGPAGASGGGPFPTFVDQTTKSQEIGGTTVANGGIFVDLVEAMRDIVSDVDASGRRYQLTGWALDSVLEPSLWGAVDTTGRPIWVDVATDQTSATISTAGRLMGRRSFMGEGVSTIEQTAVVGYGGDWSQAAWGAVGGISYRISTDAAVTINGSLVSLFEQNLVAILAEAEYGFLVNDTAAFTKLTNVGNVPVTST